MTMTDEMRAAGADALAQCFSSSRGEIAEVVYLAMRPLDPDVAELWEFLSQTKELWRVSAKAAAEAYDFLASQGYARGEDGAWEGPNPTRGDVAADQIDQLQWHVAQRDKALAAAEGRVEGAQMVIRQLEAQLATLRPVAEAAVTWEEHPDMEAYVKLRQAVRALPPEWRAGK
jgi:hypothetical protein